MQPPPPWTTATRRPPTPPRPQLWRPRPPPPPQAPPPACQPWRAGAEGWPRAWLLLSTAHPPPSPATTLLQRFAPNSPIQTHSFNLVLNLHLQGICKNGKATNPPSVGKCLNFLLADFQCEFPSPLPAFPMPGCSGAQSKRLCTRRRCTKVALLASRSIAA